MRPLMVSISRKSGVGVESLLLLVDLLKGDENHVVYLRKAQHLDIDTLKKDSYELFEAGLDFAMLVTDRHRYLKSKEDVSKYLSIPSGARWVIQEDGFYPSDMHLVFSLESIFCGDGKKFSLDSLSDLVDWLELFNKKD